VALAFADRWRASAEPLDPAFKLGASMRSFCQLTNEGLQIDQS